MMKTFDGKTAKQTKTMSQPDPSTGQNVISLAPPDYGIDFVDRKLATGPPEKLQTKHANGVQRQGRGEGFRLDDETADRINRAHGGGKALDAATQMTMGGLMHYDFSGVRVHTDSEADALNQQLQAKAFTTGRDVFFKRGEYNLGSGSSCKLIAHELAHVAQQTTGRVSGGGSGMTVRPSRDAFEAEADAMASRIDHVVYETGQGSGVSLPAYASNQRNTEVDEEGVGVTPYKRKTQAGNELLSAPVGGSQGVIQRVYPNLHVGGNPLNIEERQFATSIQGALPTTVVFPGIVTCIGLVRLLENGRVRGVHLAILDEEGNPPNVAVAMNTLAHLGGPPDVVVGDIEGWIVQPGPQDLGLNPAAQPIWDCWVALGAEHAQHFPILNDVTVTWTGLNWNVH